MLVEIRHWPRWGRETVLQTHPAVEHFGVQRPMRRDEEVWPAPDEVFQCCEEDDDAEDNLPLDADAQEMALSRLRWCLGQLPSDTTAIHLVDGFDTSGRKHVGETIVVSRLHVEKKEDEEQRAREGDDAEENKEKTTEPDDDITPDVAEQVALVAAEVAREKEDHLLALTLARNAIYSATLAMEEEDEEEEKDNTSSPERQDEEIPSRDEEIPSRDEEKNESEEDDDTPDWLVGPPPLPSPVLSPRPSSFSSSFSSPPSSSFLHTTAAAVAPSSSSTTHSAHGSSSASLFPSPPSPPSNVPDDRLLPLVRQPPMLSSSTSPPRTAPTSSAAAASSHLDATTRISLDSSSSTYELLGLLPPTLLAALAEQRVLLPTADGKHVLVHKVGGDVRVGNHTVDVQSFAAASYPIRETRTHGEEGAAAGRSTRRVTNVTLRHRQKKREFERR